MIEIEREKSMEKRGIEKKERIVYVRRVPRGEIDYIIIIIIICRRCRFGTAVKFTKKGTRAVYYYIYFGRTGKCFHVYSRMGTGV